MSVYKKNFICEKLRKLGTFQNRALLALERNALEELLKVRGDAIEETNRILEDEGKESWNVFLSSIDIDDANDTVDLFYELLILANYKAIENHMIRIIEVGFVDVDRRALYIFRKLKAFLLDNGIQVEGIIYYDHINELRLISNSIKHGGKVSKELGSLAGWSTGAPIKGLDKTYNSVKAKVPLFIEHFSILVEESCECYVSPSSKLREALDA